MISENNLVIYLSTIPNGYEQEYNTIHTFQNVKQDYCRDLSKLEKYLDIIYDNMLFNNYNRVYFMGGEIGELPHDYVINFLELITQEKYSKYTKEMSNKKIQLFTNGKLFEHISYDDITYKYKISCRQVVNENFDFKNSYASKINDITNRRKISLNQFKYYNYLMFQVYLNNNTDSVLYDKFTSGDFIDKTINLRVEYELFSKNPFNGTESKFFGNCLEYVDFNTEDCSKFSYNFGIDLVNDKIFKCYRAYDIAPTIELTEDNFKKALQYNIEYFIPKYENPEVCKRCKFFNTNQKRISFNFKK